jgi:LPXTG-motif cell wall-anchored protein
MKKINVKKLMASVAALSVVATFVAIPASAATHEYGKSEKSAAIAIGQVTVTDTELSAAQNQVPVVVKLTPNPGIDTLEFGVQSELPFEILGADFIDYDEETGAAKLPTAPTEKIKLKNGDMTFDPPAEAGKPGKPIEVSGGYMTWLTWSATSAKTNEDFVVLLFTLPENASGKYDIKFLKEGRSGNPAICNMSSGTHYSETGDFEGIDGWIQVDAATTTTEATTTTTESTTTTTTTESTTTTTTTESTTTTTTTESTTTTTQVITQTTPKAVTGTEKRGTGTLNPHKDEYYTQTTPKAVPAATARGGGDSTSPKTGASDVLPIAGAAAAVAVLGGVALVSKKKKD